MRRGRRARGLGARARRRRARRRGDEEGVGFDRSIDRGGCVTGDAARRAAIRRRFFLPFVKQRALVLMSIGF